MAAVRFYRFQNLQYLNGTSDRLLKSDSLIHMVCSLGVVLLNLNYHRAPESVSRILLCNQRARVW